MSKQTILAMILGPAIGALVWAAVADGPAAGADDEPPRRRNSDGRSGPPRLTDEQEAELLAFLKRHRPDRHAALLTLKDEHPRMYYRWLRRIQRLYEEVQDRPEDVRQATLRLWDYRVQIGKRLRDLRDAEGDRRKELTDALHELVAARFDDEQTVRRYRLDKLADHLERLREKWQNRQERRDAVIAERVEALIEHGPEPRRRPGPPHGHRPPPTRPATHPSP
ncbi:MAG: hypothetical protein KGY99_07965 [Phycisphaerae bacterium]|nr:hypothetical protein [Phycisphaerae bacterium]